MSSRTWLHRPDLSPTSAAGLARTRSHSHGAATTSSVSTGQLAWSRSRGHEPHTTGSTPGSSFTTSSAPLGFPDASLGGVLTILVLQHLPHPAAFIAEIRRCLRPGGHLLITAPSRNSTSLTTHNLYWWLRTAFYLHVPGVVRFYDTNSLPTLIGSQGLTVINSHGEPGSVSVLARAGSLVGPRRNVTRR